MISMDVELLPMAGLVAIAVKVFDPCDARGGCDNDSLFHRPCLNSVFHQARVGWSLENRMETEAQTVEPMPVALVIQIKEGVCSRTRASCEVLPHTKRPAESEVIARHDAVVLMGQSQQVANLVEVGSNADVGSLPTAASIVAVVGHEICVGASGVREGVIDLVEAGRITLKTMRSEYAKLNLAISATKRRMTSDGLDCRVPMGVEIHGRNVMDLIWPGLEMVMTSSRGNREELILALCGLMLLSIIQLPDLFHGLVQTNDVHFGLTHHAALPRRLDGGRLLLPLLLKAERPEAKTVASHHLGREGLPHVCRHAELPNGHGEVVSFHLDATGSGVVGLGGVFGDQDGQVEGRGHASRDVDDGD